MLYRYEALAPDGEVERGDMEAADVEAVVARLRQSGRLPLRARRRGLALRGPAAGVPRRELALFTRELASLLHAGLDVHAALQVVLEVTPGSRMRRVVADLQAGVRAGRALSEALEAQRGVFSPFYVSMVRAAEAAGSLQAGLQRIAEHEEKAKALRDGMVSALIYPAILAVVAAASLLVLLAYVVPQLTPMFADAGRALPLSTQVVLAAAEVARSAWPLALAAGVALVVIGRRLLAQAVVFRVPVAGTLVRNVEMARLARSLGALLASGVSLLAALAIARQIVSNHAVRESLGDAAEHVKAGGRLADALIGAGLFPAMGVQLLRIGEEGGRLEDMLARVADIYDREVAESARRLLAALEPALIVILGTLIGGVVVSLLSAIVTVNDLPL